ncbi:hypothetical protein B0O80DRAFT_454492 [Mortierella sp. GBAus27b]|nr:hypothetical protein B0O80DRAFT_454492 [Mortierella sp. GBAus27b]
MLQTLTWHTDYRQSCGEQFCDYLAAQTWPFLDWIDIRHESRYVTNEDHVLLLRSIRRPLRCLDVNIRFLEQPAFDIWRKSGHFETLTKVNLIPIKAVSLSLWEPPFTSTSKWVQEILESCPLLEHIVAAMITAQDIIQGKPWVCRGLKKFEVMINLEPNDNNHIQGGMGARIKYTEDYKRQCHQIFERLGQLHQLTVLNMTMVQPELDLIGRLSVRLISIPLELKMGLGHLSTLKNLESIGYYGAQDVRMVDVEWMLQHWRSLRWITGGPLSMKRSKTFRGELVRLFLIEKTLEARRVLVEYCQPYGSMVTLSDMCGDPEPMYDSDSESEDGSARE